MSFLLSILHLRPSLLRIPSAAEDHRDSTEDEREHFRHRRANVGDEEHHQRDAECAVEDRGNLALRRLRGDVSVAWRKKTNKQRLPRVRLTDRGDQRDRVENRAEIVPIGIGVGPRASVEALLDLPDDGRFELLQFLRGVLGEVALLVHERVGIDAQDLVPEFVQSRI